MARKATGTAANGQHAPQVAGDSAEQEQLANMTPEQIFEKHYELINAAKIELDAATEARASANGVYRDALKTAKKQDVDTDALIEVLRLKKLPPEDVSKRFSNINRYMFWLKLPAGAQLGLFDENTTVATAVEEKLAGSERMPMPEGGYTPETHA